MKNKRNVIVAFLLVAALCLGIGYAEVADKLFINADLSVNAGNNDNPTTPTGFNAEFDQDIYFSAVAKAGTGDTDKVTAVIGNEIAATEDRGKDDIITITAADGAFDAQNEYVTITATVKNDNATQSADVTLVAPTGYNDHFKVEITPTAQQTIAAGGTQNYEIKITLVKIPERDIDNAVFQIVFTAVPGDLTTP